MSYSVEFWVPGQTKTERKRQRIITSGTRQFVGARTDEPDRKDWKNWVRLMAKQHCPEPLHGPLALTLTVQKPKPASLPKRPTAKHPWPDAWMQRPDVDNYVKLAQDALHGICYIDDGQIVELHARKQFGEPGLRVRIETADKTQGGE